MVYDISYFMLTPQVVFVGLASPHQLTGSMIYVYIYIYIYIKF